MMAKVDREVFGYSGNPLLSDWWYWTKKIAKHQSKLKQINGKHTSKRLKQLYIKRKRRFRHYVNTIVSRFVHTCWLKGVSELVIGDLTGIRANNSGSKKTNSIIRNFWSHKYLIQRIGEKSEEYGIKVTQVDESYTSSVCPRCGSTRVFKIKRLFKCLNCKLEAHRDAVGCISLAQCNPAGAVNRSVSRPLLLSADDAPDSKSSVMLQMSMNPLESGTSHALA